jgi:hypothetical protein
MTKSIEVVWRRLTQFEGHDFNTIRGKPFKYEISGSIFIPSRTDFNIGKSDFEKALELVPIGGPGEISDLVRGSSYIWAVLHDSRIRQKDW